jgi:hypothetical protein
VATVRDATTRFHQMREPRRRVAALQEPPEQ